MTTWEPGDAVDEGLAALRVHDASPERVERIRARCVAVLVARRGKEEARGGSLAGWRGWLEPAFALGLGALYLAEAVSRILDTANFYVALYDEERGEWELVLDMLKGERQPPTREFLAQFPARMLMTHGLVPLKEEDGTVVYRKDAPA